MSASYSGISRLTTGCNVQSGESARACKAIRMMLHDLHSKVMRAMSVMREKSPCAWQGTTTSGTAAQILGQATVV